MNEERPPVFSATLLQTEDETPHGYGRGAVREVLEVAGLAESFDLYDDLESATADCSGGRSAS